MHEALLKNWLEQVQNGELSVPQALEHLRDLPFADLGDVMLDTHRELRNGYPEVIYCAGKTPDQVRTAVEFLLARGSNILATRAEAKIYAALADLHPDLRYNPVARTVTLCLREAPSVATYVAVVTAGTSDLPVAEEAAETAQICGSRVERVNDVGVAGIHRVFAKLEVIRGARVVVVVAGMEGALPSVIGGLVDKPVIAVPTSIGYGASFNGLAALLGMLNSCASGVSVVNIDNGFGAGYLASMINRL